MALTNAEKLAEAEEALHKLLTGSAVVRLKHGVKEMEFAPADADKLRAYIAQLRGGRVHTIRVATSKGF